VEATSAYALAYKPNLAFYLATGVKGLEALKLTIELIPEDIPVILDCKVGDIGNTMQAYIFACFEEYGVDAITINPLMGTDVLLPLLADERNYAFALALTSNPSAAEFFQQKSLAASIGNWIGAFPVTQLGAVVGATQTRQLSTMRNLMPDRLFLIPGIGAQGGDLTAVIHHAVKNQHEPEILINSSRGIIFADKTANFAETAAKEAQKLRDAIKEEL